MWTNRHLTWTIANGPAIVLPGIHPLRQIQHSHTVILTPLTWCFIPSLSLGKFVQQILLLGFIYTNIQTRNNIKQQMMLTKYVK
ncbi:hypothetical protein Y032_0057g2802 [Ancylostoma ceylanicum]|uniref:Uncharacterized protein n=1 Tax=Ancylostoma ceylanicum TaxID=53326 RepID=A0A016U5P5_9BILA|nr:hypothetical protein Y032_0057g2802 [Ancylostoma ceylanicum]